MSSGATVIDLTNIKLTGKGTCDGGVKPRPPLHDFPLLAWMHAGHEKHGKSVFTEDQKASVYEIAQAVSLTQNHEAIAAQFGTTVEHVTQAVNYALRQESNYLAQG